MVASLTACSLVTINSNGGNEGGNGSQTSSSAADVAAAPATEANYPVTGNIVYFEDSLFWANGGKSIYIDYWSSSNYNMVEWPGKPMTYLGDSVYSFELPDGVEFIVFSNNLDKDTQTRDIIYDGSARFFKPAIEKDKVGAHYVKDWDDKEIKTNDVDGGKGY